MNDLPNFQIQQFEALAISIFENAKFAADHLQNNLTQIEYHRDRLDYLINVLNNMNDAFYYQELEAIVDSLAVLSERMTEMINTHAEAPIEVMNFVGFTDTGRRGRPRIVIDEELLLLLRQEGVTWANIARILGISDRSLRRIRCDYNLVDPNMYSDVSDEQLDQMIRALRDNSPNQGESYIFGWLRTEGYRVQRKRVRESIRRVDPIAPILRQTALVTRRRYSVAGPNSLWHHDGWHKLIRWGFVVHGFIDGYSRLLTGLRCSTNNRAATVRDVFIEAIGKYGCPSRLRGDRGGENVLVAEYITAMNGTGRSSYIFGTSVHNQRIERIWREVQRVVGLVYRDIFYRLEEEIGLDVNNQLHIFALHYVYLPRLREDLERFRLQWNRHGLSTERYQTPRQLFMIGMMQRGFRGIYFNPDTDDPYRRPPPVIEGPECVNDHDVGPDINNINPAELAHVDLDDPRNPLDEERLVELKRLVDPLDYTASPTGIELYCRTVGFLTSNVRFVI